MTVTLGINPLFAEELLSLFRARFPCTLLVFERQLDCIATDLLFKNLQIEAYRKIPMCDAVNHDREKEGRKFQHHNQFIKAHIRTPQKRSRLPGN